MEKINSCLSKKVIKPSTKIYSQHQDLAYQIASDFGDTKNIGIYMRICKKFPDQYVRSTWKNVKEINPNNPAKYFTACIFRNSSGDKNNF